MGRVSGTKNSFHHDVYHRIMLLSRQILQSNELNNICTYTINYYTLIHMLIFQCLIYLFEQVFIHFTLIHRAEISMFSK